MAANASPQLPPTADLPHGDRNLLVGAIAERLRCSAGEPDSTAAVMRETALDCAQALEQL